MTTVLIIEAPYRLTDEYHPARPTHDLKPTDASLPPHAATLAPPAAWRRWLLPDRLFRWIPESLK